MIQPEFNKDVIVHPVSEISGRAPIVNLFIKGGDYK